MKKLLAWLLICPVVLAQVPSLDDTLRQAVSGPQALTQAMEPWLDANGFDRLREALKTAKPKTAAEWHGVALLQQGLMDHEAVLAAFKKACGMKTGVTAEMRLSLARELARSRQFAEALQTSDALETASLDAATARELFWLLAGISTEGDFRSAGLERIRKLAAARPDDLELQTSLIRLERRHGSSSATEQKVREGFEKATGPQARSAWLLLSLEEHLRQGRLVQLIEVALSHLGEIAAGSDDERQALEQVRQGFQNGREDPKLTTRPQDIAAKYPQRPAIVLVMAEILLEQGETSEAASLLGSLKDNPQAGRLLAEWAEEDDREESLPPVVPAQVTEVKSAGEVLPEATWRVELASLKEAEARSGRLIELRRERPDDEELAMAGIELWTGQQRPAEALHEALRMHHRRAGDEKRLRGWWTSLLQGQAGWAIRQQGMHLPWLVNDPAFAMALRTANGRVRPADQMDPALWREVHEALTRGLTRFAARTMLEHANDEALDADQAGRLAVGLMAVRAWKEAAAFLGLQQVRFPKDYRLAFLHGIALEGNGDAAGAEKVFLSLGGFTQEVRFKSTQQPFSGHGILPSNGTQDDPWVAISQAVELSTRFSQMLAQWREHAAYSGSDSWRVLPPTVKAAGAWGMVQLLEIAAKRDGPGREDLARRAREAGLPLPELLVAGKLASESQDGYSAYTRLELDEAWLLEHVELEWSAQALLRQLQMRMFRGRPLTPQEKAKDAGTAREAAGRLMEKSPRLALQAALQAWQLMPEAAMPPEVPATVEKAGADREGLLSSTLATLPLEARRKAAAVLLPLVVAQAGKEGLSENQKASIGTSALWLGGWKEAASLAAGLKQPPVPVQAPVPAWAMMHASSPLSWPPQAWPWFYETSLRWLPETEKAAFLEAGTLLPASSLRIAWLHAGGDAPRAEQEVKAWIKAEPDSQAAVLAMASLLIHDKKPDEALDLLHRHATRQKDAEQRRMALRLYLQAAFFPGQGPSVSMYNERGRSRLPPPPEKHEKRLRQAATELLPEVRRQTSQWSDAWQSVFQALNLAKDAPTQRARFEASYWTGNQNARDELEDSRNRRRERQSVHSYGIKRLLEAKKKPQAIELMLRQFRRDADQRFSGPASRLEAGQMEEWRQLITQEGLAAELIKEAAPHQPDDSRRLAQAVHVAEVCGDWAQAVTWAEAALKLDPDLPWMKLALASARQQLSGDPAVLVAALRDLPPAEAKAAVLALLQQAQRSADFPHRLAVAQAALDVLSKHPGVLEPETVMRDGVGIQTLSSSAYPPSEVLRQLFELLTQAVQDREGKRVAEGLHPGWSTYRQSSQGDSAKAATPALLDRRKTIHAQLCELALKHPEWAETALRPLTGRHLIEGVPSKDALLSYARQAMEASPGRGPSIIQNWTGHSGAPADAALRYRLAALVIPLLEEAWKGVQNDYHSQTGLVELIGGTIPPPGERLHPLYALWEQPYDIDEGTPVYTPEQLSLNKQRRGLFEDLWQTAQKIPVLKREVFPAWASYRLHAVDDAKEVIEAAKDLPNGRGDLQHLQQFIHLASQSYTNSHHILTAEVVEALLRPRMAEKKTGQPFQPGDLVPQAVRLALQGRDRQAQPMPPLNAPAEEVSRVLGENWQKRRLQVLERFEELFGEGTAPMPPDLLFTRLEETLLAGKDAAQIEKALLRHAGGSSGDYEPALRRFILTANGGQIDLPKGSSKGVWDLKRRLTWFETALRLGVPLLKPASLTSNDRGEWLGTWIGALEKSCEAAVPPVPNPLGMKRETVSSAQDQKTYQKNTLLVKRDDLLLRGLELEVGRENPREYYFPLFTLLHLHRGQTGMRRLVTFLGTLQESRPQQVFNNFIAKFTNTSYYPKEDIQLGMTRLLLEALKRLPAPPSESRIDEWFHGWRLQALNSANYEHHKELPLLPEQPWLVRQEAAHQYDFALQQPLARERLTAWKQVLDHMGGVPGLSAAAFPDLLRLHLEEDQVRLLRIARAFTDEQWFQVEQRLENVLDYQEAGATPARRAAWGRFAMAWEPEATRRLKNSPDKSQYRRWPKEMLEFLRHEWNPNRRTRHQAAPAPTDEERAQQAEAARQYAALLEDDPTVSPEGFSLFARKQFATGQTGEQVLKLARQKLAQNPGQASRQIEKWCHDASDFDHLSTAECEWIIRILVTLAAEWPAPPAELTWSSSAAHLMRRGMEKADSRREGLFALLDQLWDALLKNSRPGGEVLDVLAFDAYDDPARLEKLGSRIQALAEKDAKAAAAVMNSWMPGEPSYRHNWHPRTGQARMAIRVLQNWPRSAPDETLSWVHGLAHFLSAAVHPGGMPFEQMDRTADGSPTPSWIWPAPGLSPEERSLQRMLVGMSSRVKEENASWRLPLNLRLTVQPEVPEDIRIRVLKPLFDSEKKAKTLAVLTELLGRPVPEHEYRHHMHMFTGGHPDAPTLPDKRAAAVIDACWCLHLAIREKWLPVGETVEIEQTARARLQTTIQLGQMRQAEYRPPGYPFPLGGVLESQMQEARKLLDSWPGLDTPSGDVILPPALIPSAITQSLQKGEEVKTLAARLLKAVTASPVPAVASLEKWAALDDQRLQLSEWLRLGPLASALAGGWTKDMPPPEWLPVFLDAWKADKAPADPEKQARHEKAAVEIVPGLRAMLRRYPACRYSSGYFTQAAIGYENGSSEALARLAVEHLLAQRRGSINELYSLPYHPAPGAVIDALPERPDALLILLDHLAISQDKKWLEQHCRPAIQAALSGDAAAWWPLLEAVALCPPADFGKAIRAAVQNPERNAFSWYLRMAAWRKIPLSLDTWTSLTGLRTSLGRDYNSEQPRAASLWIAYQTHLHRGEATRHIRELFRSLLGAAYDSESQRKAFQNYRRDEHGNEWHGWPYERDNSLNKDTRWPLAYEILEDLTASPDYFRATLEIARETGLGHAEGALSWLMLASRREQRPPHPRWQALLAENHLLEGLPDDLWLLPQDGLVPAWEFAKALGITANPEAARWLEARHLQKPSSGTAIMLLAARRAAGAVVSVKDITAALTPCLPELKKSASSRRAAFSAALLTLQPALRDDPAISEVVGLLPVPATTPERKALAARWLGMSSLPPPEKNADTIEKRLLPLALDVFRLLEAHDPQALAVARHGLTLHAAHPWPQPLPAGITRLRWLHEQLAAGLLGQAHRGSMSRTSADFRVSRTVGDDMVRHRLEVLLRFLKAGGEDFSSAAGSQLVRRVRERQAKLAIPDMKELPLAAWALEIGFFGTGYQDYDLGCLPLRHLEKLPLDAPETRTGATQAAKALAYALDHRKMNTTVRSLDIHHSAGETVVKPLLALLTRFDDRESRRHLLRSASRHSMLPLECLLEEICGAADTAAACVEWMPLYFHDRIGPLHPDWLFTKQRLPGFTASDEKVLAALRQLPKDAAPAQAALFILSALPDASVNPPSQNRETRLQTTLAAFDGKNAAQVAALDRLAGIHGLPEELLPLLRDALRQHPEVIRWRQNPRLPVDTDWEKSLPHQQIARLLTLHAAAEALHGGDASTWTTWAAKLDKSYAEAQEAARSRPEVRQYAHVWSISSLLTLTNLSAAFIDSAPHTRWPALIALWESLAPETRLDAPDDSLTDLRVRLALASGDKAGAKKRLNDLVWHVSGLPPAITLAKLCDLSFPERIALLVRAAEQTKGLGRYLGLCGLADAKGFLTLAEWEKYLVTAPPPSFAPLVPDLAQWLKIKQRNDLLGKLPAVPGQ